MAIQLRASSSSSSATRSWKHDVFLSFRGEDTRYNFTDHLHRNLVLEGIRTFIDDELTRGEEISQSLLQAIEGSKSSLIVFSENYASSKWCLDELVHILECKRSNQQQKVWPVFYKVDPSDVRHQRGSFGDALANHESNLKDNMERVMRWKTALSEAANLSGWHFSDGMYESKFIDGIVEEISAQVKEPTYLDVPKCLVGLDSRVQYMLQRLDVGGSDIRMVGIWGIGGIGKSTIAKAVYNSIAHNFECSCFLANVREKSELDGGLNLQNILLSRIVRGKELKVNNVDEGITLLSERLTHKRILLILDDVNNQDQLDKLAGATKWFGSGSRIIITTRDKHLLIVHKVNPIYEAMELDSHQAHELFCSKAFKDKTDLDDDEKLSVSSVVEYAQGLPLALVVLGSRLCGTSTDKWQAILDGYKRSPLQGIQKILKISYDGLENPEKEVFLDIACFFKYRNKNDVIQILEGCGRINPEHAIEVLEEKALIKHEYHGIWMHDLLEEMGKEIVNQESPNEPGERRRLWYHKDVHNVLTENKGTSKIEGIIVRMPTTDEILLHPKCFTKMKNLKIFINVNGRFCGKVDYYPQQLRFLDWPKYPLRSLPSNFNMNELVQLSMPGSRISSLWETFKRLQNLKSMNFMGCGYLTKIPNLSGCPNLERMDLQGCKSLVEVHPSVGFLENLVHLDLSECSNLVKLPRKVNWRSLRDLHLSGCSRLESFPEIVGEMKCLKQLILDSCSAIKELPSSIVFLINLESLYLWNCENLTNLPCSIHQLQNLKVVDLNACPKLVTNKVNSVVELMTTGTKEDREFNKGLNEFRLSRCSSLSDSVLTDFLESLDSASTLTILDLSGSSVVSLSECLSKYICLRSLYLHGCRNLVEIPQLAPCIKYFNVSDCASLERISKLSKILEGEESQMIEEMNLSNCRRLIENLVKEANHDLFRLFLSCQKSKFEIIFPGSEIPKWFSRQMDFQGLRRFEFVIGILPNFKWENTGLALCVLYGKNLENPSLFFNVIIHINDVLAPVPVPVPVSREGIHINSRGSDHVWLQYIPFVQMWGLGYMRPLPPFMCRVTIFHPNYSEGSFKSCGVHLVMPPNEDVCMKLSRAENITSELPSFKNYDYDYDDDDEDEDDDGGDEDEDEDDDGGDDDDDDEWGN